MEMAIAQSLENRSIENAEKPGENGVISVVELTRIELATS
jgi:hypothetical protein